MGEGSLDGPQEGSDVEAGEFGLHCHCLVVCQVGGKDRVSLGEKGPAIGNVFL